MSNRKIELQISGIAPSGSTSGAYAMILAETEGIRKLPIVIGSPEAQAIAIELEKMTPSRPLTHDLFRSMAHAFAIDIEEILIYNLVEGIFFSKLIATMDGRRAEIDARTSDAVAIAVRFNCPIYCYEFILETAGVNTEDTETGTSMDDDDNDIELQRLMHQMNDDDTSSLSIEELQRQLEQAINQEDYETASKLRDEINRRKGQ
ncbi:MAG TPA: bifunctional nuclease family protein [Flavobacteriales bacterium]